jgi:hypothetical protein
MTAAKPPSDRCGHPQLLNERGGKFLLWNESGFRDRCKAQEKTTAPFIQKL